MTKEALKLALEALEGTYIKGFTMDDSPINNAITAIKEALAQPEPKRKWLGLTWDDLNENLVSSKFFRRGAAWAEAKLKERNT